MASTVALGSDRHVCAARRHAVALVGWFQRPVAGLQIGPREMPLAAGGGLAILRPMIPKPALRSLAGRPR